MPAGMPLETYIEKEATQQVEFLEKYPNYDGRGVLIAIIDYGGLEINLHGLQKTSTGLPKIVDCFDFHGIGHVNTSVIKEMDDNNILIGLSGQQLKIPSTWKNPSGQWHLGKIWYHVLIYRSTIREFNIYKSSNQARPPSPEMNENSVKPLPLDCIVWFDGKVWRACIQTYLPFDLENAKVLTNFRDEHEFGFLAENRSYCLTISNDGNALEIIFPVFEHSTPVTHIAAGHFPEEPNKDGLAPGAQIVYFNLQENRRNNGISCLEKIFKKCIELGVDVINISVALENCDLSFLKENLLEKHKIIVVTGAGNSGPLYSSVTKNCSDIYENFIVVGSVLTAKMRRKLFKVEEDSNDESTILFSHSSKGPSNYGSHRGVDFVGPGAAIPIYPTWHSSSPEGKFCEGTSLSSPNIAGSIACLLSGLKAESIQYSPTTIKLALANTASTTSFSDIHNPLGFGHGIIQIKNAFEYLKKFSKILPLKNLTQGLSVYELEGTNLTKLNNKKGIFWVKNDENDEIVIKNYCVKLDSLNYLLIPWSLKTFPESSNFVEHSGTINDNNNMFSIKIDVSNLHKGSINYAEIRGFDQCNLPFGTLFSFPITVIIPEEKSYFFKKEIIIKPEVPENIFLQMPSGEVSEVIIKVTALDEKIKRIFIQFGNEEDGPTESKKLVFTLKERTQNYHIPIKSKNQMYQIAFYEKFCHKKQNLQNLKFNVEISFK